MFSNNTVNATKIQALLTFVVKKVPRLLWGCSQCKINVSYEIFLQY